MFKLWSRAMWVPEGLLHLRRVWLTAGGGTCTCMSTQIEPEVWRTLRRLAHMEYFVVIDESTTRRDSQYSVRWNQAYHRLAEGQTM